MNCEEHKCKECGGTTARPANKCVNCGATFIEHEPTPYECRDDPTPGFHRLGPAAQHAARSRAKAFYPFD